MLSAGMDLKVTCIRGISFGVTFVLVQIQSQQCQRKKFSSARLGSSGWSKN